MSPLISCFCYGESQLGGRKWVSMTFYNPPGRVHMENTGHQRQKQAEWRKENFKRGSAKGPDKSSPKSQSLIRFSESRITKDRHHYLRIPMVLNTPHEPGSVRGGSEESLVRQETKQYLSSMI